MTGKDARAVLHAASRLSSDSARSPDLRRDADDDRRRARRPEWRESELRVGHEDESHVEQADHDRETKAADRALDRFPGAHRRNQLLPAERAAERVGADVRCPGEKNRAATPGAVPRHRAPTRVVVVADARSRSASMPPVYSDAECRDRDATPAACRRRRAARSCCANSSSESIATSAGQRQRDRRRDSCACTASGSSAGERDAGVVERR